MNKSIAFEHISQSKEELIAQYEQLRTEALNPSKLSSHRPPGFSIVLHRGIASWIETYLCSELLHLKPDDQIMNHSILNEFSIHKEAMTILTNMILSHHKQGNCYV